MRAWPRSHLGLRQPEFSQVLLTPPLGEHGSGTCRFSLCGAVEVDQFGGGCGVLGALVVTPSAGEPREPHRQPGVFLDLPPAGAVGGGQGQLGAEDLQHEAGLEPHIGLLACVDPGRPLRVGQRRQPGRQLGQVGVGEPGAALGHRAEDIGVGVIGGQEERPVDAGAAAAPGERADDDQVDGVGQLGAVVPLQLDPQPAARAWYTASGPTDLHISPSQPSVIACSNAASRAAGAVTSAAVVSRS